MRPGFPKVPKIGRRRKLTANLPGREKLMIEPFVLKGRESLPPEPSATRSEWYDPERQIWVDSSTRRPLVEVMSGQIRGSQFGETSLTETREGVDCSEITSLRPSQFGETVVTKTREGVDCQYDGLMSSQFGETTVTRSQEGIDQSRHPIASSQFGETVQTATKEGVDVSEGASSDYASSSFI